MSSQKNAIVMGSIFFVFRLAFCVVSAVALLTNGTIDWHIVWPIAFGIGAFTDLFLVFWSMEEEYWCHLVLVFFPSYCRWISVLHRNPTCCNESCAGNRGWKREAVFQMRPRNTISEILTIWKPKNTFIMLLCYSLIKHIVSKWILIIPFPFHFYSRLCVNALDRYLQFRLRKMEKYIGYF